MSKLTLTVLSLRYSSWSMRPWLALYHTGVPFDTETVSLPHMARQAEATTLGERRKLGSVRGLFPVLRVDGTPIHESLAICEYVADAFPDAHLWPADSLQRAAAHFSSPLALLTRAPGSLFNVRSSRRSSHQRNNREAGVRRDRYIDPPWQRHEYCRLCS